MKLKGERGTVQSQFGTDHSMKSEADEIAHKVGIRHDPDTLPMKDQLFQSEDHAVVLFISGS